MPAKICVKIAKVEIMKDGLPRGYDAWRTRNAEDEQDERDRKRQRQLDEADRADEMRDRERDEPNRNLLGDGDESGD